MKVLNKEVKECKDCPCYSEEELMSGNVGWCNIVEEYAGQKMPEDCPFTKPITKEVIESFGFIYNYRADLGKLETPEHSCNPFQCILKDVNFCNSSRSVDLKMTYLGTRNNPNIYRMEVYERNFFEWYAVFEGKVNNPTELEFILNSIGVIESK